MTIKGFWVSRSTPRVLPSADRTGDFAGLEIDFGDGGEGLRDGIERGGDVVMVGEEGGGRRGLGHDGHGAADKKNCQQGSGFHVFTAGHATGFTTGHGTPLLCNAAGRVSTSDQLKC